MQPIKRTAIHLMKRASWAPIAVVAVHAICGEIFGHEPYVDPAMHFLGGAAIVYFLRTATVLFVDIVGHPTEFARDLCAWGLACVAAVVWEFGEWFSDAFLGTNIQWSGSAPLRDIAYGLCGASIYLMLRTTRLRRNGSRRGAALPQSSFRI